MSLHEDMADARAVVAAWQEKWGSSKKRFPWADGDLASRLGENATCFSEVLQLLRLPFDAWLEVYAGVEDDKVWRETLLGCRSYRKVVRHLSKVEITPPLLPEQMEQHKGKMTLVLDLDKTLILCEPCAVQNFQIYDEGLRRGVQKRLMVDEFLDIVSRCMEVVLFTVSPKSYADQVLARLDPKGTIFAHRLYREDCILQWEEKYRADVLVKDLSILGRDLKRTVLVDDSPECFCNPGNGILIERMYRCSSDNALLELLPFLMALSQLKDVRPVVAKWACNPKRAMVNEDGVLFVRDAHDSPWDIVTETSRAGKRKRKKEFKEEKGFKIRKMLGHSKPVIFA